MNPSFLLVTAASLLLFFYSLGGGTPALRADTVQLANGDSLTGEVVALTDGKLQLHSEVIGDITISRDKIAAIYFGDRPAEVVPAAAPAISTSAAASPAAAPLGANPTPDDILKQLQVAGGGIDPSSIKDITKAFPLLAQPEVQAYFNDTVGGLVSGKLDVQDIRRQAVHALEQLQDLEKDLGPGAAQALSPYKSILEKFVRESAPADEKENAKSETRK